MEKVKGLLKPRPTPQQQLREWQRKLRNECRVLDRQIRGSLPHLLLLPRRATRPSREVFV
jgi:hypothetical protein